MLELRPNCEHCDKDLAPQSKDAMICSFECTFCRDCVENLLHATCPNCGGNFVERPVRPEKDGWNNNDLAHYPSSAKRHYRPVDLSRHLQRLNVKSDPQA